MEEQNNEDQIIGEQNNGQQNKENQNYIYYRIDEKRKLLEKRKEQLVSRLNIISKDINVEDNLDDFLNKKVKSVYDPDKNIKIRTPRWLVWFAIKIFGSIFITTYLIVIFEYICLLEVLGNEIKDYIKFIFTDEKREIDFYDMYIKQTQIIPDISLFFLSSIFSDFIVNIIGYFHTTFIVFLFNSLIIFFGLLNFNFKIGEELNERYTFGQLLYLIFIYISFYIFLGFIVLLPHNMLKESFLEYDWHLISLKISDKSEEDKKKFIENLKEFNFPMNGKFFVYLFSLIGSGLFKIYLDYKFVVDDVKLNKFDKNNNKNFILTIIIISAICIIPPVIFYSLLSFFICKENDGDDDKTSSSIIKIFRYVIYIEKNKLDNHIRCLDCRASMNKCGICCGCYFCNCFKICINNVSETNLNKERIFIIYKITGILNWFFDIITDPEMLYFIVLEFFLEIGNIGFRLELDQYLEENDDDTIINIIILVSEIFSYFINLIFGLSCYDCNILNNSVNVLNKEYIEIENVKAKNERNIIWFGLFFSFCGEYFISFILSCLIHFNAIKKMKYYFIAFSIGICEYTKVIILYFADCKPERFALLSKSFQISFYLFFLDLMKLLLDIFNVNHEKLIYFQFMFGAIISTLSILILICSIACLKIIGKENNVINNEENKDSSLMINS